jgi:Ca2+-binding RTX toxin-like protein
MSIAGAVGVTCLIAVPALARNVVGTKANDTLRGTPDADRINGRGGNDRILGLTGDDTLTGGPGHDYLDGGRGNDRLLIQDRTLDVATCGAGRDRVTADATDVVRANCETVVRPVFSPAPKGS